MIQEQNTQVRGQGGGGNPHALANVTLQQLFQHMPQILAAMHGGGDSPPPTDPNASPPTDPNASPPGGSPTQDLTGINPTAPAETVKPGAAKQESNIEVSPQGGTAPNPIETAFKLGKDAAQIGGSAASGNPVGAITGGAAAAQTILGGIAPQAGAGQVQGGGQSTPAQKGASAPPGTPQVGTGQQGVAPAVGQALAGQASSQIGGSNTDPLHMQGSGPPPGKQPYSAQTNPNHMANAISALAPKLQAMGPGAAHMLQQVANLFNEYSPNVGTEGAGDPSALPPGVGTA
jgi:hypothetical protein